MQEIKDLNAYRTSLKDKILEAAMDAFTKNGIRAVKMDDIAMRLSISKRTLYEIYGGKESLLFACLRKEYQVKRLYMAEYANNHNVIEVVGEVYRRQVERLKDVNYLFYEDIQLYPNIVKFMEDEHANTYEEFLSFMQRGVKEGFFRKDVNYELVHQMFDMIGEAVTKKGLYSKYPYEELLTNLLLVPFRGFCTTKGLKMLEASMKKNNLSFTL